MRINFKETKTIWSIAIPILLGTLWDPVVNIIDISIAGHFENENYLASLAYGNNIISNFYWIFGSLGMAITGYTAQKDGENQLNKISEVLITSILFMITVSILILIFQKPIWILCSLVFNQSSEIEQITSEYFYIKILGVGPHLIIMILSAWFLGIKKPKVIFRTWTLMGASHIIIVLLFTNFLNTKLNGIGYATIISQWLSLIYIIIEIPINLNKRNIKFTINKLLPKKDIILLGGSFGDLMIRTLLLQTVYLVTTYISSRFGATTLASNGIFLQFIFFSFMTIDGPTRASAPFIGEYIGAKNITKFKSIYDNALVSAVFTGMIFTLIYLIFGENLINLVTNIEVVRLESYKYIMIISIIPVISVLAFQLDSTFSGMLKTKEMRNTVIYSTIIFLILTYFLTNLWGNYGLWISHIVFLASRGILLNNYLNKYLKNLK
tara:strand:+ start:245 stop:1558 length:1314 start_codon:yes stop_codon:yes gene_type:complete